MIAKKFSFRLFIFVLIVAFGGVITLSAGFYLFLSPKLPEVDSLRQIKLQTPLRIYTADNVLIGEFGEKRRNPINLSDTPKAFLQAILSAEDDRFYSHHGVDIKGLLRAVSQLLQSGQIQTGGSTITMQVARNFFLTRQQTFSRKFNEILLALQIERELSKDEILELYINKIYLGNRAYGIQAASQTYYGMNIDKLNLAQLAMIAGLPKAPSAYNPLANPARALIRRNWILGRMYQLNYIDEASYTDAINQPVSAKYHGSQLGLDAPYLAEIARQKAVELLGEAAYTDGYIMYLTADSHLQQAAQNAVITGLLTYDARHGFRGPEKHLAIPTAEASTVASPADENKTPTTLSEETLQAWLNQLNQIAVYANLQPAVVTQIEDQTLQALLANGDQVTLAWGDGLSQARPYITEDRRGSSPAFVSDFLAVGDVIRLRSSGEGKWQLSQIPQAQAAIVALNPMDGAIQAMVGGLDFHQSHFNRALQAERQPGSNFKPFIYTAALENGLTPATIINDAPIVFEDASLESTWRPENASGKFFGPTRLRQALYKSRNLVSIRVLQTIGIQNAISGLSRFGLNESELPHDLSLALGSHAMTPLDVATGYAVFANGGYKVNSYLVDRVLDVAGNTLFQAQPDTVCTVCDSQENIAEDTALEAPSGEETIVEEPLAAEVIEPTEEALPAEQLAADAQTTAELNIPAPPEVIERPRAVRVLDERVAYLINDMLQDVIRKGTGRDAKVLNRGDLAGKTGTTNGPKDAWFSGYNHHIVATTWLGFDQNLPLGRREYGGSAALPIWIEFMQTALDGIPEKPRKQPNGLVTLKIDPITGLRALPDNPDAIFETFRVEDIPEEESSTENSSDNSEDTLPADLF